MAALRPYLPLHPQLLSIQALHLIIEMRCSCSTVSAIVTSGGVRLNWDAMGWASVSSACGAPTWHDVAILLGGASATTVFGVIFLGFSHWKRSHIFLSMAFAVLSICFVLDGSIYMFWSSYLPNPPGDFAAIIQITGSDLLRWMFMIIGLLLTALSQVFDDAS